MIRLSEPKFVKTIKYLRRAKKLDPVDIMHRYGKRGVAALSQATPMDTGEAAYSWSYKITGDKKRYKLAWTNSVMAGSVPLVILLQYGHATKAGWFLSGRDFINPTLQPIFDDFESEIQSEVFR